MDVFKDMDPLFWSSGRLKTFDNWVFQSSTKCNPEALSSAGFFKVNEGNEPDLTECFICHKQLDGWEETDDPWEEHVKHSSLCPFVKVGKTDEKLWTIEELFMLYKEFCIRDCELLLDKKIKAMKQKSTELKKQIPKMLREYRKSTRKEEHRRETRAKQ